MGLQGKILGLWDYTLFEIGITEISFEIGIMDFKTGFAKPTKLGFSIQVNWDYGISPYLKFRLWDYTGFEMGLRDYRIPPMVALISTMHYVLDICHWPLTLTSKRSKW